MPSLKNGGGYIRLPALSNGYLDSLDSRSVFLNENFAAFAEHYGCTVIPARAYKLRDKALVEGAVKLIYHSIYLKIQDASFMIWIH